MTNREAMAVIVRSAGWVMIFSGLGQWLALGSIGWWLIVAGLGSMLVSRLVSR